MHKHKHIEFLAVPTKKYYKRWSKYWDVHGAAKQKQTKKKYYEQKRNHVNIDIYLEQGSICGLRYVHTHTYIQTWFKTNFRNENRVKKQEECIQVPTY